MNKKWSFILVLVIFIAGAVLMLGRSFKAEKPLKAMYVTDEENNYLMIDQNTGNIFTITMPDQILDKHGKKITQKDLKSGNIVAIYGDGIMLESYPGQYPGVTKLKVLEEGKTSDADQYQEIFDQIYPEKNPAELPYLNVCYTTSYGTVSEALASAQGGYDWNYTEQDGTVRNMAADSTSATGWKEITVMRIDETKDMELVFDTMPENVTVTAFSTELSGETDPGEGAEAETEKTEKGYVLKDVRPDMIYQIRGEWENGWAEYGFTTEKYEN